MSQTHKPEQIGLFFSEADDASEPSQIRDFARAFLLWADGKLPDKELRAKLDALLERK